MTPEKTPRKYQKVSTSVNKIHRLHMERNPELTPGRAYDEAVAYVRRTQLPPNGPKIPDDPSSSLGGITDQHAAMALKMATEAAKYNDYDITDLGPTEFRAWLNWA